jgi:hypothetical protein
VHDAARARHEVANDGRDEGREDRGVLDVTDRYDLETEEHSRDRRAENGAEPSRNPGCDQLASSLGMQSKSMGNGVCEAGTHLHGGPFASGASSEEMGQYGADEHHRRHANRDLLAILVDRIENEIVAPRDGLSPAFVGETDHDPAERERVNDDFVVDAKVCRSIEEKEKSCRSKSAAHPDAAAERDPLDEGLDGSMLVHSAKGLARETPPVRSVTGVTTGAITWLDSTTDTSLLRGSVGVISTRHGQA